MMVIGVQGMQAVASSVARMGLSNFGGVMFWDVSFARGFILYPYI